MGADNHPTVRPEQLRRDEVHIVIRGDDLHDEWGATVESIITERVESAVEFSPYLDGESYEIDVELDREEP